MHQQKVLDDISKERPCDLEEASQSEQEGWATWVEEEEEALRSFDSHRGCWARSVQLIQRSEPVAGGCLRAWGGGGGQVISVCHVDGTRKRCLTMGWG